jgi:L-ribulose-5-phosphate 3-epimerase
MNRRDFLLSSTALAALAPLAATSSAQTPATATPAKTSPRRTNPKGFMFQMLSAKLTGKLTLKEKFQLIRDAGFDGVEPPSAMNQEEVLAARDATGLKIPSVVVTTHWKFPLSDPNPGNRQIGLDGLKQGLRDAKAYGASSVLLVPAVVNKQTSYSEAYTRCSEEIKKVIPLAEELGVVIAIENVWNWFLLSPREAVEFADSFKSPFVKWHFDVGNVVNTGWPEQWVRELGPRIVKVHVKEFSKKLRDTKGLREGFKVNLMEGDSDWPAVMAAFDSVNYKGWLIAEQWGAEDLTAEGYLSQISKKLDDILAV